MLRIEIKDDNCEGDEVFIFRVPLNTHWADIHSAIQLFYPTSTEVGFYTEDIIEA